MPENTVKVDRTTRLGNPFARGVGGVKDNAEAVRLYRMMLGGYFALASGPEVEEQRAARLHVDAQLPALRGKNLACWCKLGAPCHADVLLELANAPSQGDRS